MTDAAEQGERDQHEAPNRLGNKPSWAVAEEAGKRGDSYYEKVQKKQGGATSRKMSSLHHGGWAGTLAELDGKGAAQALARAHSSGDR